MRQNFSQESIFSKQSSCWLIFFSWKKNLKGEKFENFPAGSFGVILCIKWKLSPHILFAPKNAKKYFDTAWKKIAALSFYFCDLVQ